MENRLNSVMFHHFHDDFHPTGQGSISGEQFENMIDWLSSRYKLIGADEYMAKFNSNKLVDHEVCLSFDDGLLCQFDIAIPVLNQIGLNAFFFVYSSPSFGDLEEIELYRYFRSVTFKDIDRFYDNFFNKTKDLFEKEYTEAQQEFNKDSYLSEYPFYSDNDKWFRYLRNITLSKEGYDLVMGQIMENHSFDIDDAIKKLWMSEENIKEISNSGNIVGLHSFSHPYRIESFDIDKQREEYSKNFRHLSDLLGTQIKSMSHPCGSYNHETLEVLSELDIDIGFRSNLERTEIVTKYEVPREDHANILMEMEI